MESYDEYSTLFARFIIENNLIKIYKKYGLNEMPAKYIIMFMDWRFKLKL